MLIVSAQLNGIVFVSRRACFTLLYLPCFLVLEEVKGLQLTAQSEATNCNFSSSAFVLD